MAVKTLKMAYSICINSFWVIGILLMITLGAIIARMTVGPINLDFAKDRIEAALNNEEKGYKVSFQDIHLTWPSVAGTLYLDLRGVEIVQQSATPLSVDHVALGLSGLKWRDIRIWSMDS